jgi:hypothetical protein
MKFSSRNDGKEPHHVVTVISFSYLLTIRGDSFHCYARKMTGSKRLTRLLHTTLLLVGKVKSVTSKTIYSERLL